MRLNAIQLMSVAMVALRCGACGGNDNTPPPDSCSFFTPGTLEVCEDNFDSAFSLSQTMAMCVPSDTGGASWSTSPCPSTGRVGRCTTTPHTQNYYVNTASTLMAECALIGGTWRGHSARTDCGYLREACGVGEAQRDQPRQERHVDCVDRTRGVRSRCHQRQGLHSRRALWLAGHLLSGTVIALVSVSSRSG
jgi:hypothetical protein